MRKLFTLLLIAFAALAQAQAPFPARPVKLVVAFPPGGSTDITARLLATRLAEKWGQPVVVENRPGAGANLGTAQVAKSPPDGHTLLLATTALSISPSVFAAPGYDALRDLAPVTMVSTIANVLVVHPDVPARTIAEFIAHLKANPGKLNFAAPGASSGQRMTFEMIKQATGTEIVMVPYAGGAPALQAVLAGQVQAMIVNVVEAATHVRSGKLRALAVTTAKRAPMLPEVPTLAETVAPQIDTFVWQALVAPAGTPAAIVQQIQRDTAAVLALPDVRERLAGMGMDIVPGAPEALARFLRDDIDTWRKVSRAANIQPE
jgi:tripartite-type tricarboxylate transporter receptor subunit TctC